MPRPRSLTRSAIADAALAVIDGDGLDALSIRSVAARLGVGAMTLYRYVEGRDDIEALVVEAVIGTLDLRLPTDVDWRQSVRTLMSRAWRAMRSRPSIVPLLLTRRQSSAASVGWGEAMLAALTAGGFEGKDRVIAFRTLLSYLIGAVQVEYFGPLSGRGTKVLAGLPADEYPNLSATARAAAAVPPDVEFTSGLEVVLDGLEAAERGNPPGP